MSDLWHDMDFALPAGHPSSWEQECKQLRAENERLRMALTAIAKSASVQVDRPKKMLPAWRTIAVERIDIARAALKGTKT